LYFADLSEIENCVAGRLCKKFWTQMSTQILLLLNLEAERLDLVTPLLFQLENEEGGHVYGVTSRLNVYVVCSAGENRPKIKRLEIPLDHN